MTLECFIETLHVGCVAISIIVMTSSCVKIWATRVTLWATLATCRGSILILDQQYAEAPSYFVSFGSHQCWACLRPATCWGSIVSFWITAVLNLRLRNYFVSELGWGRQYAEAPNYCVWGLVEMLHKLLSTKVVKNENLSSFHVHRSNREISTLIVFLFAIGWGWQYAESPLFLFASLQCWAWLRLVDPSFLFLCWL